MRVVLLLLVLYAPDETVNRRAFTRTLGSLWYDRHGTGRADFEVGFTSFELAVRIGPFD